MVLLEYIWIDGFGKARSKTKVYNKLFNKVDELPEWNYDGSSTGQAPGNDSEVIIKPRVIYDDPFREDNHKLVLCDTWLPNGQAHSTNTRVKAVEIFNKNLELEPLFGIEQEFFLTSNGHPIGFPQDRISLPLAQGGYYCGTGAQNSIGRECIEDAFQKCLYAGLKLTGLNAEVAPSQWEFQVCAQGIDAADQLVVMRYILDRTAEEYEWNIELHPKPVKGDWNGSGCHTNYSTKPMREEGGWDIIIDAIEKLGKKHSYHMENYGEGNRYRMTGKHETASYDKFSYGVADRGSCIRIPTSTEKDRKGYLEDRRPASNMDPYIVTSLIFETTS
jgi:glutamine synthetase